MERKWQNGLVVVVMVAWLVLCFTGLAFSLAHAQVGGSVYSERSSPRPHGDYIVGWNTTGSEIGDGVLVMADTTGTTSQPQVAIGKGFRMWDGVYTKVHRILGVTIGPTQGYSQGRILVRGFHPWVKLAATGYTGFTELRPSLSVIGALAEWTAADTARTYARPNIGVFQRYANSDSLRGYVWIDMSGKR